MADPTIQTFCCHWPNVSDTPVKVLLEFNTFSYNLVSMVSSMIGIFGATLQILPRRNTTVIHRWNSFAISRSRQIIIWLAVADLLASSGVFVRSLSWIFLQRPEEPDEFLSALFCSLLSAWIQYFYTATWFWTLCYAIDVRLVLTEREGHPLSYHILSWALPAILTSVGLLMLYLPYGNCHSLKSLLGAVLHILPNYFATYIPIAIVMIANPILYIKSRQTVKDLASLDLNQYTSKERKFVTAMTIKFCMINAVFYICWLPNIINGILLWTLWFNLPENIILALWYIMAISNPLQAALNCAVYRRWSAPSERLCLPCGREMSVTETLPSQDSPILNETSSETTPLIQRTEATTSQSINAPHQTD